MLRFALLPFVALLSLAAAPARALDASPWERVLVAHARGGGMDYDALAADARARADLDRFLASAATMPESEPLSSWLNVYNALVVKSVLAHRPIASVQRVPGFFDRERHRVAGRDRTLDELENQIVRPRFHDARVHFALNCGADSCPALHGHAFVESTLSATLDRLAKNAVASDTHVRVTNGRVEVSEIFFWFQADFERDAGSVLAWLRRYDERRRLAGVANGAALGRIPYRWALNQRSR